MGTQNLAQLDSASPRHAISFLEFVTERNSAWMLLIVKGTAMIYRLKLSFMRGKIDYYKLGRLLPTKVN